MRSNFYSIVEDKEKNCILLRYDQKDDQDLKEGKDFPLYDTNIQVEEDLFLRMPVVQEIKVLFLNMGGILQDTIKETYDNLPW